MYCYKCVGLVGDVDNVVVRSLWEVYVFNLVVNLNILNYFKK